ncbi:MAG TPA: hypothetical protein VFQ53_09935 [Kofleriaceae bacterium]|nr:hypothetical protein [Kofleriaceae bacterium]
MKHSGGCHCGAIGFAFETALAPSAWAIRACQCTFCRAHAALSSSDPQGRLAFVATDPAHLVRYRFGLGTADFLLCSRCGVYLGARTVTPEGTFGVINVHALQPIPPDLAAPSPTSYDGEPAAARSSRRAQRWTPVVDELDWEPARKP